MSLPNRTIVLHRVRDWLPQTKTWIYEQLRWLPPEIEAHVACDQTENLDQFPYPRLHVLGEASRIERSLDRFARRVRSASLRSVARLALQLRATVFHSHFGQEAWRELPLARVAGLPQVVTFYGHDVTRVPASSAEWRRRYRELFANVTLVLCEGPHMREELLRQGAPASKVRVQHLGVDLERLTFAERVWGGRGPVKILMAAGFREKKGLPFALRAVAQAQQARPELDLRVTLVGDASSDPDSQAEKQAILEAAGLLRPDTLTLLGFCSHVELIGLAAQHHVLMSPSVRAKDGDTEGGAPVALIELAALGLPVISTTHCDIPNVLRGPARALLAAERDVAGLTQRLLWALEHSEEVRETTRFVRSEIQARFDARIQARELAGLYAELRERAKRPHLGLGTLALVERGARWLRERLGETNVSVTDE